MSTLFVALAVLIADQLSKFLILKNFQPAESLPIIKNIFHLSLVFNKGIAFGVFSQVRGSLFTWIALFAVIIIFLTFCFCKNSRLNRKSTQFYLALILGGAAGNLIDRIRLGYIIDFLDFRIWPVFNLADSAISLGTVLLLLQLLKDNTLNRRCIQ